MVSAKRSVDFPNIALVLVAVALIATAVAPSELTLGSSVKLVFLHAALMWVAIGGYTASGLVSLASLAARSRPLSAWADAALWVSTAVLAATGGLGLLTAKITWGGVLWREPRMLMLAEILGLSVVALILTRLLPQIAQNLVRPALAAAAWYLLLITERIVHPVNPIFTSGNVAIIFFPLFIASCLLAAAYMVTGWLSGRIAVSPLRSP